MRSHVRVSEILSRLFPYKDIDPVVLEEKAKIGTNVHKAILEDCSGDFIVFDTDRAQAYFESYKIWDIKEPKITQVPRLYCDRLMITGECDGLLDGTKLIDWKCSANPHVEQWNMQAHFYWYLLKENGYNVSDNMMWVNLRHKKHIFRDSNTGAIKKITYVAESPISYEFKFDQNVLDRCIEATILYWEEKSCAKSVA